MLNIDGLQELAVNRRSIRGYDKTKDVPDEWVRRILDCARWAPSGGNGQPWEFIVIRDEKTRHQIADIFLKQQEQKKEMEMAVRGEAKLKARAPLVFLNACETGQQAPSLTDWGGWPKTFWEAGAGAFVGTSWSVRERPAAAFSEAFYTSLLKGDTLAGAARAARTAAKAIGDASWLAFVVYGHPMAQLTR